MKWKIQKEKNIQNTLVIQVAISRAQYIIHIMIGWDGFYLNRTLAFVNYFCYVKNYTTHCWKTNLRVNSYEGVSFCVELLFERDNNCLEILDWLVFYVVGHLRSKKSDAYFIFVPFCSVCKRPSYKLTHTLPMLVLSKAASISSRTKKGAGL